MPEGWKQSLKEHVHSTKEVADMPKGLAVEKCVRDAQQKCVNDQLDHLLETLKRAVNMVSFTILIILMQST